MEDLRPVGSEASGGDEVSLVRTGGPGVACYGQARLCRVRTRTGVTVWKRRSSIASCSNAGLLLSRPRGFACLSILVFVASWTTGPWLGACFAPCWPTDWAGEADSGRDNAGLYTHASRGRVCAQTVSWFGARGGFGAENCGAEIIWKILRAGEAACGSVRTSEGEGRGACQISPTLSCWRALPESVTAAPILRDSDAQSSSCHVGRR